MSPTTEQINCLRLIMTDNIGPITYGQLISYYGSATEAITHLSDLAERGGGKKKLSPTSLSVAENRGKTRTNSSKSCSSMFSVLHQGCLSTAIT